MIELRRFGFCALLLALGAAAQAQPLDADRVKALSEIAMTIGPLQVMRDTCANLFPEQATVIRGLYDASAQPAYAKLLGYDIKPQPSLDRDKELQSLGMSEDEATTWCFMDFPTTLNQFDELYKIGLRR